MASAAAVSAIAAVVAAGTGVYSSQAQQQAASRSRAQQKEAQTLASAAAGRQEREAQQAAKKAADRRPDVLAILGAQRPQNASTLLTGPLGITTNKLGA